MDKRDNRSVDDLRPGLPTAIVAVFFAFLALILVGLVTINFNLQDGQHPQTSADRRFDVGVWTLAALCAVACISQVVYAIAPHTWTRAVARWTALIGGALVCLALLSIAILKSF